MTQGKWGWVVNEVGVAGFELTGFSEPVGPKRFEDPYDISFSGLRPDELDVSKPGWSLDLEHVTWLEA